MRRRTVLIAVATIQMLGWSNSLQAGSIWARRSPTTRSLYTDDVARRIGDVLTIKIAEDSKVDNKSKRDLQKQTELSGDFSGQVSNSLDSTKLPGFTLDSSSNNSLKSKADFKDERSFVDSVTVVVVDRLPNGNLVVTGTRDRNIAGDIQTIEVSGIVRPSDIAYDNTIKSQQVANFRIVTKNGGVSAPYTKPGWLGQIINVIWPW